MLEIKPICENCGKLLPNDNNKAMICTFECAFCIECVENVLFNVCPNCGGGFEKRPTRPKALLEKYPVSIKKYLNPITQEKLNQNLLKYREIDPTRR